MSGAQSSGLAAATQSRFGEGRAAAAAEAEGSRVLAQVFLFEDLKRPVREPSGPRIPLGDEVHPRGGECSCSPGSPCSPSEDAQRGRGCTAQAPSRCRRKMAAAAMERATPPSPLRSARGRGGSLPLARRVPARALARAPTSARAGSRARTWRRPRPAGNGPGRTRRSSGRSWGRSWPRPSGPASPGEHTRASPLPPRPPSPAGGGACGPGRAAPPLRGRAGRCRVLQVPGGEPVVQTVEEVCGLRQLGHVRRRRSQPLPGPRRQRGPVPGAHRQLGPVRR